MIDHDPHEYKVTAIVSTYNSEKFIQGCVDDLFNQTLYKQGQLEIIVVVSGSQQNEVNILIDRIPQEKNAGRCKTLPLIFTQNRETLYAAWNRAIKIAKGEYITNANTDDRHRGDALEVLADTLDKKPEVALAYGNCWYSKIENMTWEQHWSLGVRMDFRPNERGRCFRTPTYFAPALLLYYPFGPQPMWRKSVHDEIGLFDETYKAVGDWDFAIRLGQRYRALHVDEYLGLHYVGYDTISSDLSNMVNENSRIRNAYQNLYTMANLYRRQGISSDSLDEKIGMLSDVHKRAEQFICPNGGYSHDAPLQTGCLDVAFGLAGRDGERLVKTSHLEYLPSQRELSLWEEEK